jgi:hypothetical protein
MFLLALIIVLLIIVLANVFLFFYNKTISKCHLSEYLTVKSIQLPSDYSSVSSLQPNLTPSPVAAYESEIKESQETIEDNKLSGEVFETVRGLSKELENLKPQFQFETVMEGIKNYVPKNNMPLVLTTSSKSAQRRIETDGYS